MFLGPCCAVDAEPLGAQDESGGGALLLDGLAEPAGVAMFLKQSGGKG